MHTNLQRPRRLFAFPVRYEVPTFQRRYVWDQERQWEPLWSDVENLAESILDDGQAEAHFLGAVVLQRVDIAAAMIDRRIVVDGQQRLTTLQLLIDAVQEVLELRGHSDPAMRLSALVHNAQEFRDGDDDNAFKVWPTAVDRAAFRHAMNNDLSGAEHASSRIVQAHDYFKAQVEQWLAKCVEEGETRTDRAASALEEAVGAKLELVVIDLGGTDDPHVIFQTLNARGTPLLQSDMVKNRILYDAKVKSSDDDSDRSPEEKRLWAFDDDWWAREVGRGLQRRPRVDVFLNHWLTIRNRSETRPYDEFSIFERYADLRIKDGDTIFDIARDIRDLGDRYRDVENGRPEDIASFLERRNVMNLGVVTPLLLWFVSSGLPPATLENCLRAIESFFVRRVVCGYSARSYGALLVSLIARLHGSPIETADRIVVKYLAEQTAQAGLWPDDRELREKFVSAPLYQWLTRGRLRMVLTGIEERLRTTKTEIQSVSKNLHIEHIMPQAWHRNWPLGQGSDDDTVRRDRTIHTIGNLTLVTRRLNSSLSNAAWSQKRKTLADHSVLFLNKGLLNDGPEIWDEQAIEDRAKWLHERAVEVWPHADGIDVAS